MALYVRDDYTCEEVHVFDLGNEAECVWVNIKGRKNSRDVLVGVYYRPPGHSEDLEDVFLQQMTKLSRSEDLIIMGEFNYAEIY